MLAAMMQIAGETGSATEMLDQIALDYESDLETIANQIDKILEPITIVVMGTFVGLLVYADLWPDLQPEPCGPARRRKLPPPRAPPPCLRVSLASGDELTVKVAAGLLAHAAPVVCHCARAWSGLLSSASLLRSRPTPWRGRRFI